jgi:predicted nucleotidyltransferase
MNLDEITLQKICNIYRQEEKIKKLILFGSRAKGTAKAGSDIDLAVIGDGIGFREICQLGTKLDDLDLPYEIDIVNYNTISNTKLKEHIDRVGIEIEC